MWVARFTESEEERQAAEDFAVAARPDLAEKVIRGSEFVVAYADGELVGALGYRRGRVAGYALSITSLTLAENRPAGVYHALNVVLANEFAPDERWIAFLERGPLDTGVLLACIQDWEATVEPWVNDLYRVHGPMSAIQQSGFEVAG